MNFVLHIGKLELVLAVVERYLCSLARFHVVEDDHRDGYDLTTLHRVRQIGGHEERQEHIQLAWLLGQSETVDGIHRETGDDPGGDRVRNLFGDGLLAAKAAPMRFELDLSFESIFEQIANLC